MSWRLWRWSSSKGRHPLATVASVRSALASVYDSIANQRPTLRRIETSTP
jgi:hypothetical protein